MAAGLNAETTENQNSQQPDIDPDPNRPSLIELTGAAGLNTETTEKHNSRHRHMGPDHNTPSLIEVNQVNITARGRLTMADTLAQQEALKFAVKGKRQRPKK